MLDVRDSDEAGCVSWTDKAETFDIRIEVQAPVNGTEAYNGGTPSSVMSVTIGGSGAEAVDITQFFGLEDPEGESSIPSEISDEACV